MMFPPFLPQDPEPEPLPPPPPPPPPPKPKLLKFRLEPCDDADGTHWESCCRHCTVDSDQGPMGMFVCDKASEKRGAFCNVPSGTSEPNLPGMCIGKPELAKGLPVHDCGRRKFPKSRNYSTRVLGDCGETMVARP